MVEDSSLDATELAARFEPQLVAQHLAHPPVRGECFGLPASPEQGDHQVTPQSLPERMLAHEHLELADELAAAAGGQVGGDPGLQRTQILLSQPNGRGGEPGVRADVRKRFAAPQRDGLAQCVAGSLDRTSPERVLPLADQRAEAADIDIIGSER